MNVIIIFPRNNNFMYNYLVIISVGTISHKSLLRSYVINDYQDFV